ncbi:MAG: hypothetical protein RRX95_01935 [Oscillospiraceae bacterium]
MFKQLLKNEFMSTLAGNNMLDTKKGKAKNPLVLIIGGALTAIAVLSMSAIYSYSLAVGLIPYNGVDVLPVVIFAAGSIAVFFYGALKSSSVLFGGRDFDFLMSMPISDRTVIGAKLAYLYLSDLAFALGLMVPSLCVWIYFQQPGGVSVALTFLSLPFVPVIPIVLATIVGTLVGYASGFTRHKAAISTVANLAFVMGIMYLSMSLANHANDGENIGNIALALKNQLFAQYPPAKVFYDITQGSVYAFVLFVALSAILLIAYMIVISGNFVQIHSRLESSSLSKSSGKLRIKTQGRFISLIKKEADMFFATPIYVVNMGVGVIMCLGAVLYVIFFGQGYVAMLMEVPQLASTLIRCIPVSIALFLTLTTSSCCSVSMEGKSLWLCKSLPISGYDVLLSKVLFNLCITAPVALISLITSSVILHLNVLWNVAYFGFVISICLFWAFAGLFVNLKYPNFQWENPVKVVKQGVPVIVTTFGSMIFNGICFWSVVYLAKSEWRAQLIYVLLSAAMFTAVFMMNSYLRKNAEKILIDLE